MNFLFSVPRWWILHVPRGWQETRGHCSGKISGTPGRPEQTDPFHQVRGEPGGVITCERREMAIFVCGRFRLACHGRDSTTSYLPVTVFIQDINDNPPVFQSQGLYNCTAASLSSALGGCCCYNVVIHLTFTTVGLRPWNLRTTGQGRREIFYVN